MLYQQIRPESLDQVRGNEEAVAAVRNILRTDDRPHVFLLAGPSGTGKTTLARILATAVDTSPINVIEKNAASSRGIDMIRELEKIAGVGAMGGGSRFIILDEAHMLTREAQHASLKLLEDIPSYQYYALCTTEPNRLLPTIRTRCARIDVKKLSQADLIDVVLDAAERGGLGEIDESIVLAIVQAADGCPRTAITILETQQGLEVTEALRIIAHHAEIERETIDLCRAVAKSDWREVVKTYKVLEKDLEAEALRRALLGYLKTCLLGSVGSQAAKFADKIDELIDHTYDSGHAGLTAMLYHACNL